MLIKINTCNTQNHVEKLEKKVTSLEQNINHNDSLDREINAIEREIATLETAREVVYTNNAIVRTTTRPDDVMNSYTEKIKELQNKRKKLNATRK